MSSRMYANPPAHPRFSAQKRSKWHDVYINVDKGRKSAKYPKSALADGVQDLLGSQKEGDRPPQSIGQGVPFHVQNARK